MSVPTEQLQRPRWPALVTQVLGDRVVIALGLGILALAAIDPSQVVPSLRFTGASLLSIAPYLGFAMAVAAYAKASGSDQLIARAFSGNPATAVVAASLVGALSPFCSCGVVPLIAAMLVAGVPLAPVMAFWIASPIMDPEMFVLTAAGIGLGFAIAKTIATVSMGLMAGFVVLAVERRGWLRDPLKNAPACGTCRAKFDASVPLVVAWKFWRQRQRREAFYGEIRSAGWFLGKWLAIAFFLESLMVAYVPTQLIVQAVGEGNPFAVPLAALVGIPSYLNGYAAIPLVAGLLDMGMSSGAAMTFITSGAVSSIPAAIAVYALVKKSVFALYALLGLTGSILAGYAYQLSLSLM
ncbi:MAG: permease [Gammaproteobacteria bacterium]|nr:MAG: permease [Gammaproteobacteria bacterium]